MANNTFIKIQKKFGGMWVATSKTGARVYAAGKNVKQLMQELKDKKVTPTKTVIGYIPKYGQIYIYLSFPVRTERTG